MPGSRLLLFIIFIFSILPALSAQNFSYVIYDNEDGLSSSLVKKVLVDEDGLIFAATDGGINIYDGYTMTSFSDQLPSSYVKDIICYKPGEKIVVTDFGAGVFSFSNRSGSYKPLPGDTGITFNYPKSVFIDSEKNIWISEIDGLVKSDGNSIKRYPLDDELYSESFIHSFTLAEDDEGRLFVFSWQGAVLRYDKKNDRFEKTGFYLAGSGKIVDAAFEDGSFYIATGKELLKLDIDENNEIHQTRVFELPGIISFRITGGRIYAGTDYNGIYLYNIDSKSLSKVDPEISSPVYSIDEDKTGGIWFSSDVGIIHLFETRFVKVEPSTFGSTNPNPFISRVSASENGVVFTDQDFIYRAVVKPDGKLAAEKMKPVFSDRVNDFAVNDKGIWVSLVNGELSYYQNFSYRSYRQVFKSRRINALSIDSEGHLWGFLGQENRILRINNELHETVYLPFGHSNAAITNIKELGKDKIYFSGIGSEFLFFYYDKKLDSFIDLSDSIKTDDRNFSIYDFCKGDKDVILLATSNGIKTYGKGKEKYSGLVEMYKKTPVKSVNYDKNGLVWLGTDKGLFIWEQGKEAFFSRENGLPSATITERGITIDKDGRGWIATPTGIAYNRQQHLDLQETPVPKIVYVGGATNWQQWEFPTDSELNFAFTSLVYPSGHTIYQYYIEGYNKDWSDGTVRNTFSLRRLPRGNYKLLIRARHSGYQWSKPAEISFSVNSPWYLSEIMISLYFSVGFVLFFVILQQRKKKRIFELEQRRQVLAALVEEKTGDLLFEKEKTERLLAETEQSRMELEEANKYQSQIMHIAAHDLKNPLQSISGICPLLMEDRKYYDEYKDEIDIINQSSGRMLKIISKMLESSEASSAKLDFREEDISGLARDVVNELTDLAAAKDQEIETGFEEGVIYRVDAFWFKRVIENLVSNAIKYSPKGKKIYVKVYTEKNDKILSVRDEGPGFTEEDRKMMFRKFQKLSARPTNNETSTGLGLFIIKEVVEKHGGKIELADTSGNGAEFFVILN